MWFKLIKLMDQLCGLPFITPSDKILAVKLPENIAFDVEEAFSASLLLPG